MPTRRCYQRAGERVIATPRTIRRCRHSIVNYLGRPSCDRAPGFGVAGAVARGLGPSPVRAGAAEAGEALDTALQRSRGTARHLRPTMPRRGLSARTISRLYASSPFCSQLVATRSYNLSRRTGDPHRQCAALVARQPDCAEASDRLVGKSVRLEPPWRTVAVPHPSRCTWLRGVSARPTALPRARDARTATPSTGRKRLGTGQAVALLMRAPDGIDYTCGRPQAEARRWLGDSRRDRSSRGRAPVDAESPWMRASPSANPSCDARMNEYLAVDARLLDRQHAAAADRGGARASTPLVSVLKARYWMTRNDQLVVGSSEWLVRASANGARPGFENCSVQSDSRADLFSTPVSVPRGRARAPRGAVEPLPRDGPPSRQLPDVG